MGQTGRCDALQAICVEFGALAANVIAQTAKVGDRGRHHSVDISDQIGVDIVVSVSHFGHEVEKRVRRKHFGSVQRQNEATA